MIVKDGEKFAPFGARDAAYCAAECALLIAVQVALSPIAGVELVTVALLCFASHFGPTRGVVAAVCFSLLRVIIFGFNAAAFLLYLIYYPVFALVFGLLGRIDGGVYARAPLWLPVAVGGAFLCLAAAAGCAAGLKLIRVSIIYEGAVEALLWVICGISLSLLIAFCAVYALVKRGRCAPEALRVFLTCAVACAFTVCFTLLDDVITPLIYAFDGRSRAAYFYASFTAMLPQVVCTACSVTALYPPVTLALSKACPKRKSIDKRREKL